MNQIFFSPDPEMVRWLAAYAKNRLLVEVGCGQSYHLIRCLAAQSYPCLIGIDPEIDYMETMMFKHKYHNISIHLLSGTVEQNKFMISNVHPQFGTLIVIARPCH